MASIAPFKGTRYSGDKIKDLSKVVAPPYDVILPKEQDELYKMSEYNIVRMLFGKDSPSDNENENRYTRAKKYLKAWQEKAVLKKDSESSIYINLQEFKLDGKIKRRIGFLALLKLEEFDTKTSSIHPHEFTLAAPKEDRAKLIHSIEANLGPIFAIFEDPSRAIANLIKNEMKSKPIADISDNHGVRNKFWRVSDKKVLNELCGYMKDKKLFIADGHHRYEVGLAFSKLKKDPKYGYTLTYFTDLLGDGLVVLPYHRLIGSVGEGLKPSPTDLKKHFHIKNLESKKDINPFLSKAKSHEARFVIYMDRKFTGLIFKDKKDLDVAIAKKLIIDPLGKISIDFTKDLDYAVGAINDRPLQYDMAILLNPVKITEIRDAAFRGSRMPQKSTYFYPKVLTGLVINVF